MANRNGARTSAPSVARLATVGARVAVPPCLLTAVSPTLRFADLVDDRRSGFAVMVFIITANSTLQLSSQGRSSAVV